MTQLSLLDSPTGRVHHNDPQTSRQAAIHIAVKTGALKHRILTELASRGDLGASDWELHLCCDPKGRVHSAATRRGELEALGLVRRTSRTRPTDTPGCEGVVHVLTEAGREALRSLEQ